MKYNFAERLEFSQGSRINFDLNLIRDIIPHCVSVNKTDTLTDKTGIDYIAKLRGGAEIGIDVKTREKGASRWWKNGEAELALEIWSVCPDKINNIHGKRGWTLSDNSNVDLILYTFDSKDCEKFYLLPFQHLRTAFIKNGRDWINKFQRKKQNSNGWQSEAVFVPASIVLNAIQNEMFGNIVTAGEKN